MTSSSPRAHALPPFVQSCRYVCCIVFMAVLSTSSGCSKLLKGDKGSGDNQPTDRGAPGDPNDHTPPAPPTIESPTLEDGSHERVVSWTQPEGADAARYELSLTSKDRGCARPIVTYSVTSTSARLAADLPGGHYLLCLQSFDANDNGIAATNQGEIQLEQPVTVHYAILRGEGPDTRALVHGTFAADAATPGSEAPSPETVVASPVEGRRIAGRASLQIDAAGAPKLAFLGVADGIATEASLSLTLAQPKARGFGLQSVLLVSRPEHVGLQGVFALSESGESYLAQTTKGAADGGSELLYTESHGGRGAVAVTVDSTDGQTTFQDASLVFDDEGRLHVVYIQDGHLVTRLRENDGWTAPTRVDTPGCTKLEQLSAAADGGRIAVAYTCTRSNDVEASCALGLARANSSGAQTPEAWRSDAAVVVDDQTACLPFSSARPAIGVDATGRAHLAARVRTAQGFAVAYGTEAEPGGGVGTLAPIGAPDPLAGFPQLALDATGRVHVLYLTSRGLNFAVSDGQGREDGLRAVVIGAGTEAGRGAILELADIAIAGGRGRSHVPFGDWLR